MTEQKTHRIQPSPRKRQSAVTMRSSNVKGRTNFHAKFISWSWRKRGNVPRIQMKTKMENMTLPKNQNHEGTKLRNEKGADPPPRNSVVPSPEMENMARYSPRKNSANLKPEYSVWYPATSSDSPSGRS